MPYRGIVKTPPPPDPFELAVREATVEAGRQMRALYDVTHYEQAISVRNAWTLTSDFRWKRVDWALEDRYVAALAQHVQAAGDAALASLVANPGKVAKAELATAFNLRNAFSEDFIRRRGAAMVEGVTARARADIRDAVEAGMVRGVPVRQTARAIRESIGLDPRQRKAVSRLVDQLTAEGRTDEEVEAAAAKYGDRLLARRAETIARTETMAASNQGVLDSWRQARSDGLLPGGMLKQWIHGAGSERTCPICTDLGEQDPIPMDESWVSDVTGEQYERPPAHPNCRCTMGLVRPEDA